MDESNLEGNDPDEALARSVVYLWDLSAPAQQAPPLVLTGHQKYIRTIAFSPDSRWLVTGSEDRTARLWNLNQIDPRASSFVLGGNPGTVTHVTFSPDGRFVALGCAAGNYGTAIDWSLGNGTNFVKLWKLNPSARPEAVGGHNDSEQWGPNLGPVADRINELSFSPDGKWLVALSSNWNVNPTDGQIVKLWRLNLNASDLRPGGRWVGEYELHGHEGQVLTAAFGLDGRWLMTGGKDTSARLLDLANDSGWATFANRVTLPPNTLRADELLRLAQRAAVRNLTVEEWNRTFPTQPYRKFFASIR
jgi:WD40 repeat protein